MKKNHLFGMFAMAAFAFASCSQDEVVTQSPEVNKAIEFGTYVGRDAQTRAHSIETVEKLAEDDGFGVFAYYTNGANFNASTSTPNFMYNQQVTSSNQGTTWTYTPLKYWPNESEGDAADKLTFFAYAPYSTGGDGTNFTFNTNSGLPTLNFAVNATVKDQEDLLWAAPHVNLTKNAANADIDDAVKFVFKHALARIGFDVQTLIDKVNSNTDGTADNETTTTSEGGSSVTVPNNGSSLDASTTVVVKQVTLSGKFITSGTLAWTEGTGDNAGTYTAAITNSTLPTVNTTYTLKAEMPVGNGATLATNFNAADQTHLLGAKDSKLTIYGQSVNGTEAQLNCDESYIMIIPKNFEDKEGDENDDILTIEVTYDVVTADGNLDSGYSQVTNVISTSFTGINFEAGKAYKFSLHLGLTSVKLTASVDKWIDGTSNPETDYAVNVPLNFANDNN